MHRRPVLTWQRSASAQLSEEQAPCAPSAASSRIATPRLVHTRHVHTRLVHICPVHTPPAGPGRMHDVQGPRHTHAASVRKGGEGHRACRRRLAAVV
eukprot:352311-Chlamydomonas_euryale.AAC.6